MKYSKSHKLTIITIFILFLSCKKGNEIIASKIPFVSGKVNNVNIEIASRSQISYLNHFKTTRGYVGFNINENIGCSGDPINNFEDFISLSGFTSNSSLLEDDVKYISVGNLIIAGNSVPINEKKVYEWKPNGVNLSNLYGNEVSFSIDGNTNFGYPKTEISMYIPKLLNIQYANSTIDSYLEISRIGNFQINWDSDSKNENGVLILLRPTSYLSNGVPNPDKPVINSPQNVILAIDDGNYIFKQSDFTGFPNEVHLQVLIMRGNIAIANIDGCKTKFMVYEVNFLTCLGLKN